MHESSDGPLVVHEAILLGYLSTLYKSQPTTGSHPDQAAKRLRHMQSRFLCTGKVWQKIFQMEAKGNRDESILEQVYELWRKEDIVEATICYAEELLKIGKGKEASALIVRSKSSVGQKEQEEMETRWVRVIGVN